MIDAASRLRMILDWKYDVVADPTIYYLSKLVRADMFIFN